MMFDASCASCGAINKTPLHYEGISIKCVTCGAKFVAVDPKDYLFKFHCSSCGGRIEAKEGLRGTLAPCPHCEKVVPVGDYTQRTKQLSEPMLDPETANSDSPPFQVNPANGGSITSKIKRAITRMFGG